MTSIISRVKKNRRPLACAALAFVACALSAVVLTWPMVTGMNTYYFSPEVPGDGAGLVASEWYQAHAPESYRDGDRTTFYAYPFGAGAPDPWGYQFIGFRHALTRLMGAQASYNLLVLLSFPLAGIAFFMLAYYITRSPGVAAASGFLYAFSPWHVSRAFDQLSLTAVFTLPLFLLALAVFWRRRDAASAAGLAGASLLAIYSDLHFGLFCAFIAAAWAAAALIVGRRAPLTAPRPSAGRWRTVALTLAVVAVVSAASVPAVKAALYRDPDVFEGAPDRGDREAADFSSDPWNYFVPPAHTLLWRGLTDDFVGRRLGARTTNEVTAYPGLVTYGLALAAVVFAVRQRRGKATSRDGGDREAGKGPPAPGGERSALSRSAFLFCVLSGVGAFVLSLPPYYEAGGFKFYTPSALLEATLPVFRYYCRWALVVTFSACLLAALGLALVRGRLRSRPGAFSLVCVLLVGLFFLDVTIVPPSRSIPFGRPPETLAALARYPADEPVAIYPLAQGLEFATLHYMYYQRFHGHPMLNGTRPATEADLYRLSLKDLYSAYTPHMLSGLGIRKVAVLESYFANREYGNYPYGVDFDPGAMPAGYRLVEKTGDGYLYDVVAEPAGVYPLFHSGYTAPGIMADGRSWSAMVSAEGRLELANRGRGGDFVMSMTIANPGAVGSLTIELDGSELGRLELEPGVRRLVLPEARLGAGDHRLVFKWDGMPVELDGTPFRAPGPLKVYLLMSDPQLEERRG